MKQIITKLNLIMLLTCISGSTFAADVTAMEVELASDTDSDFENIGLDILEKYDN